MPTDTWWNLDVGKRDAIVAASMHEFAMHAYDDASVSTIVQHVGIAKGSIYQYFADKSELYASVLHIAYEALQQHLTTQIPLQLYANADMFAILRTYLQAIRACRYQQPACMQVIARSLNEASPVAYIADQLYQRSIVTYVTELVSTAYDDRSVRADIEPDVVMFVIEQMCRGVITMSLPLCTDEFIIQLVDMIDRGARYRIR